MDSAVGLDLRSVSEALPIKSSKDESGVASWVKIDSPPRLVVVRCVASRAPSASHCCNPSDPLLFLSFVTSSGLLLFLAVFLVGVAFRWLFIPLDLHSPRGVTPTTLWIDEGRASLQGSWGSVTGLLGTSGFWMEACRMTSCLGRDGRWARMWSVSGLGVAVLGRRGEMGTACWGS